MRILKDIIFSFYSGAFYHELARSRRGIGVRYVLALTVIALGFLVGYFVSSAEIVKVLTDELPKAAASLPAVSIKAGKFAIDRPDGRLNLPLGDEKSRMWLSVDIKYKVADIEGLKKFMAETRMVGLVTADYFVHFDKNGTLEITSFSDVKQDFTISHERWEMIGLQISKWGMIAVVSLVSIVSGIAFFLYIFIATFLSAIVIKIISMIVRSGIGFGAAMRLAAACYIPFNAITNAPMLLGSPAIVGVVSWLVWLGYLVFAAMSSKNKAVG